MAGQRGSLFAVSAFSAIAAGTIGSLILFLPVAAFYRTVDFAESHFDIEVDALVTPELRSAVDRIAEPDSTIAFTVLNPATIETDTRVADHALVYFTEDPSRLDDSWFPDSTVLSNTSVAGDGWIDLSAGTARALGVTPGDTVVIPIVGRRVELVVRRVMAIARFGFPNVAVGPVGQAVRDAMNATELGNMPVVLLFRTTSPINDVRAVVEGASPADKTQVLTRLQWLNTVHFEALMSEPVRLGGTILGLLTFGALAIREGRAIFRRRRKDLVIMLALGADRRRLIAAAVTTEALVLVGGLVGGWGLVVFVGFGGLLGPALPPSLNGQLIAWLVGAGLAYLATLAVSLGIQLQRFSVAAALADA